jgi:hypothetical protein
MVFGALALQKEERSRFAEENCVRDGAQAAAQNGHIAVN